MVSRESLITLTLRSFVDALFNQKIESARKARASFDGCRAGACKVRLTSVTDLEHAASVHRHARASTGALDAERAIESAATPLRPVFLGLRISLHLLVTALVGFVIVRQILTPERHASWIIAVAIVLFVSYIGGAFLVFPLFFLQLHLLRARWAVPAIALSTAVTVVALAIHSGWNVGGVIGPVIGATAAVVIGLGYRALYRETRQRQGLIDELLRTRAQLAAREHRGRRTRGAFTACAENS